MGFRKRELTEICIISSMQSDALREEHSLIFQSYMQIQSPLEHMCFHFKFPVNFYHLPVTSLMERAILSFHHYLARET